nr:helix-turn-helix transcriptional regulator [uncultured Roseateles sp.]
MKPPRRRTRFALALDADGVEQLGAMSGAIGLTGFYDAAITFMRSLIDAELGVAFLYSLDERPKYLAVQGAAARQRGAREVVYLAGPYILDPVYQMFQNGKADGAYAMAEYVPDDFYDSEFYDCFFRNTNLVDTLDVLWRIDARSSIALCLGREHGTPPFEAGDLALVRHALPLLFAALQRHQQLAVPPQRDEDDTLVHRKLQSTMEHFGASMLTKREREVIFYMLSGYSSEQTAQRLNTAEGTIRIHRKNIHRKLETSSQAELFSLFIQCIPFADPDTPCDPLERYQSATPEPKR